MLKSGLKIEVQKVMFLNGICKTLKMLKSRLRSCVINTKQMFCDVVAEKAEAKIEFGERIRRGTTVPLEHPPDTDTDCSDHRCISGGGG